MMREQKDMWKSRDLKSNWPRSLNGGILPPLMNLWSAMQDSLATELNLGDPSIPHTFGLRFPVRFNSSKQMQGEYEERGGFGSTGEVSLFASREVMGSNEIREQMNDWLKLSH